MECEPARPGHEREFRIVPIELLPKVHRGILEDLVGVVEVWHQGQYVTQDLALSAGE
jgi:hypothetical protein